MKSENYKQIFFLFFTLLFHSAIAQKIAVEPPNHSQITINKRALPMFFQKLGGEEDLPTDIRDVVRDKDGFLWINAYDGIYRYDGIHIKKIEYDLKYPETPVVNRFQSLSLGHSDTLWAIGDYSQPCYFDPISERFIALNRTFDLNDDSSEPIAMKSLLEDSRGIVWISMVNEHGLNIFDPATGQLSQTEIYKHLPKDFKNVIQLMEDSRGNLWVNSHHLLCLSFKKGSQEIENITHYPDLVMSPYFGENPVRCFEEDSTGYIWAAGFASNIFRINPKDKTVKKYTDNELITSPEEERKFGIVNQLVVADDGKIWMANKTNGISIFDPATAKFTNYRFNRFDPLSIGSDNVSSIYKDETGTIWVSTLGGGLNYYNPKAAAFGHFRAIPNESSSLSSNLVQSFFEDSQGNIWIGTADGLNKFDRQTGLFKRYYLPASILQGKKLDLLSITEISTETPFFNNDDLLIGSSNGLLTFNSTSGKFSKLTLPNETAKVLETDRIFSLTKDQNGQIWANAAYQNNRNRIFYFDPAAATFQEMELIYEQDTIIYPEFVFPDTRQNYWIYSHGLNNDHPIGLHKLDLNTKELTRFFINENEIGTIEPSLLTAIWKDNKDRYWLGGSELYLLTPTGNKPYEYDFEDLTEVSGLSGGAAYSIIEDDNGQVWISSTKGLIKVNPETMTFENYRTRDGLQGLTFTERAHYKSPTTGDLYFGGLNGFNVFHPKDIQKDSFPPSVIITDVEIFRDSVMQKVKLEKLKDETGIPIISLFHQDKILKINYAALHFAAPKHNQYAVKLEGDGNGWRRVGNESSVTYTNLDAGDYTFRVKAANKDGVWNEVGTSIKVIVHPPWWATWWAYLIYLALVVSAIYYLYQFQLRRNLEKQEAENLKEIDKIKTRFFSNITHEFRTPLTLILGPAKQLHDEETQPKKQKRIASIVRNATHLLGLINQLLDLSKLEGHQMNVELKHGDLINYTQELVDIFEPLAKQKLQTLQFLTTQEIWETNFDQDKWNKIIYNLLSNAIKFTQEEGSIELSLTKIGTAEQEIILLKVIDNGKGIEAENLNNIFNRFYQADGSATRLQEGAGIGLSLVKELVEIQNGEIQVQSKIGEGTTFEIKIPILKSAKEVGKIEKDKLNIIPIWVAEETKIAAEQPSTVEEKLEVLIIEDNADMQDYISSCLDTNKYQIRLANDGETGIEKAFELIPDLIISDVMMPKKDGYEVVTAIRQNLATSHIPIVLLTAKASLDSRLEGLKRGTDVYLTKPFSPEELNIRVNKLIELRQMLQQRYQNNKAQVVIEPTEIYQKEDDFIIKLRTYITENINNSELSVDNISKDFYMSRTQLYRKTKALTNESVTAFILNIRLERAFELLQQREFSVSEIAYDTGFTSPSYFSTRFKKRYGKSPSEV